jgi:hypothetical protein
MLRGVIEKEAMRKASPTAPKRITRWRSRTIGRVFVKYSYAVSNKGKVARICTALFRHTGARVIRGVYKSTQKPLEKPQPNHGPLTGIIKTSSHGVLIFPVSEPVLSHVEA